MIGLLIYLVYFKNKNYLDLYTLHVLEAIALDHIKHFNFEYQHDIIVFGTKEKLKNGSYCSLTDFISYQFIYFDVAISLKIKMILDTIIEGAKKQGFEKYISGEQQFYKIIEYRAGKLNDIENERLALKLDLDTPADVKEKIQKLTNEAKEKFSPLMDVEIEQSLGVGNKLPNFGQIKKVFEEGTAELSAKQGQVLLIDVWATWCGPCQKPMAHNEEMLKKNNWGDRVRIVGVSVDDDVETIKQRVESKDWKRIEHLTLGGWDNDHELIKQFSVCGIPFVCLVDTKGEIFFTGHPSELNLEETINNLLQEGGIKKETKTEEEEKQISSHAITKLRTTIADKKFFEEQFGKIDFISSKIETKSSANKGKLTQSAEVKVYVNQENADVLEQYQKLLESKDIKFEGKIVETFDVPDVPPACTECKVELNYPIYWCKWSENPADFRCRNCVQKKITQKQYNYPQNSVLLTGPTKKVAKSNLGQNIQPAVNVEQVQQFHQFGCNGCGGCPSGVGQARYICAGCRSEPNYRGDYVDLCQDCLNKYLNGDEDVYNSLVPDGHTKNHPFLRVLYNVKGYYKF